MTTELRTFVYLDRIQPHLAAFMGANMRGYLPVAGMSSIFVEIAPGLQINQIADAVLKSAAVQPGMMIVERSFGLLEFHSKAQADVRHAGNAALQCLGIKLEDRFKPKILSSEVIRRVNDYHAQVINVSRCGSLLLPGQDLYIMEVTPAAYITLAVNEAEKNAQITIVDIRPSGAAGRMYLSGKTADIENAARAAESAINSIIGVDY